MLESLEKPNIKNLVLESPRSKEIGFDQTIALSPKVWNDLEKSVLNNQHLLNVKLTELTTLKLLHPESLERIPWSPQNPKIYIEDAVRKNIDREFGADYFGLMVSLSEIRTVFPNADLSSAQSYIDKVVGFIKDDEHNGLYTRYSLPYMRYIAPEIADEYATDEEYEKRRKEFDRKKEGGFDALYNAYLLRLLNPSIKPFIAQEAIEEIMSNERVDFESLKYLAFVTADEVSFEDGIKLTFYDRTINNPIPPYPQLEKV